MKRPGNELYLEKNFQDRAKQKKLIDKVIENITDE